MWIAGRNLSDDGWILVGLTDHLGHVALAREAAGLVGLAGAIPGTQHTGAAKRVRMRFRRRLTALTDRDAALLQFAERTFGFRHVRFPDAPTRVVRGEFLKPRALPVHEIAALSEPTIEVEVDFVAYNAASYDAEPRVLVLGTSATEIPLGDLASGGVFTWGAAWSAGVARTLTLRDLGGVPRWVGTFTTAAGESLGAADHLEMSLTRRYLTKVTGAGVRTNVYHWFTSGEWPVLDPAWQSREATRYLTVEASAGTLQFRYRRAYAL